VSHRTKRLLLLVVWVVPIAGVVWWATKQQAPTFPSSFGGIMALVGALALYAVATLMRGERWAHILWRADVKDATRSDAYALVPVGYMGNNVLPARGGSCCAHSCSAAESRRRSARSSARSSPSGCSTRSRSA